MVEVIILAAGKGVRMGSDRPKVLAPLSGRPIISYLLDAVEAAGVCERPTLVVRSAIGPLSQSLGPRYRYVEQPEPLGTGHAVRVCEPALSGATEILILGGDHPFVSAKTLRALADSRRATPAVPLTITITTVNDFRDWRQALDDFGRVRRDETGRITALVEKKDAVGSVLLLRELNAGFYAVDGPWLWQTLPKLVPANAAGEYYLTDLVGLAIAQGYPPAVIVVEAQEAFGINTPEHLAFAEGLLKTRGLI